MTPVQRVLCFFIYMLISTSAIAADLSPDMKLVLKDFVASQNMKETWPTLVGALASLGAERMRESGIATLQGAQGISDTDRKYILKVVEPLLPSLSDEISAALLKVNAQALMEDMAFFVYAKHFSVAELRQLTSFYSSPTGKKVLRLTPAIIVESKRPGAILVMERFFSVSELADIKAFSQSNGAKKMQSSSSVVKPEVEAFYNARTESLIEPIVEKYNALVRKRYIEQQNQQ